MKLVALDVAYVRCFTPRPERLVLIAVDLLGIV